MTDKGHIYVVLMKSKLEVFLVVKNFIKEVGVPDALITDGVGEESQVTLGSSVMRLVLP